MSQNPFASFIKKYFVNSSSTSNVPSTDSDLHTPDEVLDHLCSIITKGSDLDMERQVHDIIIKNIEYDNSGRAIDHDALGPLVRKKGVCDGISKLAKIVFDRIGIRCEVISGVLKPSNDSPGPHAWNVVLIDGSWYHLDITADLGLSGDKKHIRYDYFNLSDKEVLYDHTIDPVSIRCVTSYRDYYSLNGLFVNDVNQFEYLVLQTLKKSDRYLAVRLPHGMDPNITQIKLLSVVEMKCKLVRKLSYQITYSMNPDQMVFVFLVK